MKVRIIIGQLLELFLGILVPRKGVTPISDSVTNHDMYPPFKERT